MNIKHLIVIFSVLSQMVLFEQSIAAGLGGKSSRVASNIDEKAPSAPNNTFASNKIITKRLDVKIVKDHASESAKININQIMLGSTLDTIDSRTKIVAASSDRNISRGFWIKFNFGLGSKNSDKEKANKFRNSFQRIFVGYEHEIIEKNQLYGAAIIFGLNDIQFKSENGGGNIGLNDCLISFYHKRDINHNLAMNFIGAVGRARIDRTNDKHEQCDEGMFSFFGEGSLHYNHLLSNDFSLTSALGYRVSNYLDLKHQNNKSNMNNNLRISCGLTGKIIKSNNYEIIPQIEVSTSIDLASGSNDANFNIDKDINNWLNNMPSTSLSIGIIAENDGNNIEHQADVSLYKDGDYIVGQISFKLRAAI